jgi:methyl-accepting chemotaxis protein
MANPKREKKRSLRMQLVLVISIMTFVVCIGGGTVLYKTAENIIRQGIHEILIAHAEHGGVVIDSVLQKYMAVVETIADMDQLSGNGTMDEKMAFLKTQAERHGYARMTIVDRNGKGTTTDGMTPDLSERDYFKIAAGGKTNVSDPVISDNDNKLAVVVAAPIKKGDTVTGVLTATFDAKMLSDITNSINYSGDGYAFMLNGKGEKIAHANYDLVLNMDNDFENVKEKPFLRELVDAESKMIAKETGVASYTYVDSSGKQLLKMMGYAPVPGTNWSIGVTAPETIVLSKLTSMQFSAFVVDGILLIIVVLIATGIAIWISRPILALTGMVGKMAALDLTAEETDQIKKAARQSNEIGSIARSILHLKQEFHTVIKGVRTESQEVMSTVDAVLVNIGELNNGIQEVSATTEELSAGMEETAASTQEMNATSQEIETAVESIASRAQEGAFTASAISQRATELSRSFGESQKNARNVLSNTSEKLNKALEESKSVEQINTLSDTIMQITAQTNLLALNAAIEAARAGESGKGFAVVAEEIRKLAEDSKTAVTQIQQVIKTVISSVENLASTSNDLLRFVSKDVEEDYRQMLHATEQYNEDASSVNSMTMDFSATSEELLASIQNMIKAINEITEATNEGADGTGNIAGRSTEIVTKSAEVVAQVDKSQHSADKLIQLVSKFTV